MDVARTSRRPLDQVPSTSPENVTIGTPSRPGGARERITAPSRSRTRLTRVAPPALGAATTCAPPATAMPGAPLSTAGAGPAAAAPWAVAPRITALATDTIVRACALIGDLL